DADTAPGSSELDRTWGASVSSSLSLPQESSPSSAQPMSRVSFLVGRGGRMEDGRAAGVGAGVRASAFGLGRTSSAAGRAFETRVAVVADGAGAEGTEVATATGEAAAGTG